MLGRTSFTPNNRYTWQDRNDLRHRKRPANVRELVERSKWEHVAESDWLMSSFFTSLIVVGTSLAAWAVFFLLP